MRNLDRFDPNLPIYMCCCNYFHATTGVKMVCCVEVFGFVLLAAHSIINYYSYNILAPVVVAVTAGFAVSFAVAIGFVARAVQKENHKLLQGHFVVQACSVVAFVGLAALCSAFVKKEGQDVSQAFTVTMVLSLTVILVQAWFIAVMYACYRFYKDKSLGRSGLVI